jgi:hypothetical protein
LEKKESDTKLKMAGIQKIVMTKKVIFIEKNSETKNINAI